MTDDAASQPDAQEVERVANELIYEVGGPRYEEVEDACVVARWHLAQRAADRARIAELEREAQENQEAGLEVAQRERDRLWCYALTQSGIDLHEVQKVLVWFNAHRPDVETNEMIGKIENDYEAMKLRAEAAEAGTRQLNELLIQRAIDYSRAVCKQYFAEAALKEILDGEPDRGLQAKIETVEQKVRDGLGLSDAEWQSLGAQIERNDKSGGAKAEGG